MFSHVMLGTNDVARSKAFYDAVFGALGGRPGRHDDRGRLVYLHDGGVFMVTPPIDGAPATHANGGTIGFKTNSPEQTDAWSAAGAAAGGTSIEDAPGLRDTSFGGLHLAYLRDPDGNKLCAMYRLPKQVG